MNQLVSQGVEELIAQLREQGVNAGKESADIIIADARKQATEILQSAMSDSETMIADAIAQADSDLKAGKNALLLAARDISLEFQASLTNEFSREAERMLSDGLTDKNTIHKIILMLCGDSLEELGDISSSDKEIMFSESSASMTQLVQEIGTKALERGVKFGTFSERTQGICVRIDKGKVKIDFTEKALAEALLAHLQPRFKSLLAGLLI